jgi:hypothetical protein
VIDLPIVVRQGRSRHYKQNKNQSGMAVGATFGRL